MAEYEAGCRCLQGTMVLAKRGAAEHGQNQQTTKPKGQSFALGKLDFYCQEHSRGIDPNPKRRPNKTFKGTLQQQQALHKITEKQTIQQSSARITIFPPHYPELQRKTLYIHNVTCSNCKEDTKLEQPTPKRSRMQHLGMLHFARYAEKRRTTKP